MQAIGHEFVFDSVKFKSMKTLQIISDRRGFRKLVTAHARVLNLPESISWKN